jgi:hypothetical protein
MVSELALFKAPPAHPHFCGEEKSGVMRRCVVHLCTLPANSLRATLCIPKRRRTAPGRDNAGAQKSH